MVHVGLSRFTTAIEVACGADRRAAIYLLKDLSSILLVDSAHWIRGSD